MNTTQFTDDQLTRMHTAFVSFDELVNGTAKEYAPSLTDKTPTCQDLADRYDAAQQAKGDPRRAWRGRGTK